MPDNKPNVGIISFFGKETRATEFLPNLVRVQLPLVNRLLVIAPELNTPTDPRISFYKTRYVIGKNVFSQIANQILSQLRMSWQLLKLAKDADAWIIYGGDTLLLPMLTAKILRIKIMVTLAGNLEQETKFKKNLLNGVQILLKKGVCRAADNIILYASTLVKQWHFEKYAAKVIVADHHYIDLKNFTVQKPLDRRSSKVGYIGRLSPEKGSFNFLRALPLVLQQKPEISFILIGSGSEQDSMVEYCRRLNLQDKVTFVGRVPREDVPKYLNDMILCVLPSYTEGMPNVVLEAMACGTPVLVTPVGALPDIIRDSLNGFLIDNNSPETIAAGIIRALEYPAPSLVAETGRRMVAEQFTIEAARHKYQKVIEAIIR